MAQESKTTEFTDSRQIALFRALVALDEFANEMKQAQPDVRYDAMYGSLCLEICRAASNLLGLP